jgi:integrase
MTAREFTTRWIESVKVGSRTDFIDPYTPGLMLRVSASGVKSWALLYRRQSDQRRRRVTLGRFPRMGLKEARVTAAGHFKAIGSGADPAGEAIALRKVETVSELLDRYIADSPPRSAKWATEVERIFRKNVRPAIGGHKINIVTRADILAVLNAVKDRGSGVAANRTLAAIRRALNWAVAEGHMATNPAVGVSQRVRERPRDRALSEEEIRAFWTGLDNAPMAAGTKLALKLALVTGQRIGEIAGAPRSEFDLDKAEWIIPAERTKKQREHLVPLSPMAVDLLRQASALASGSQFIFPSRSRSRPIDPLVCSHAMRVSRSELGLKDKPATPHDLRRTVASHMAAMGIGENIVARVLNHATEIGKTITGRAYIRHSFAAEKRHALEAWAAELGRMFTKTDANTNVVRIGKVS